MLWFESCLFNCAFIISRVALVRTPAVVDCQAGWPLLQTVTPFRGMQSYIQKPKNMIASILTELYTIIILQFTRVGEFSRVWIKGNCLTEEGTCWFKNLAGSHEKCVLSIQRIIKKYTLSAWDGDSQSPWLYINSSTTGIMHESNLLSYSPLTMKHVWEGWISVVSLYAHHLGLVWGWEEEIPTSLAPLG